MGSTHPPPGNRLNGLVLAGGNSTRMGIDKAWIEYHGMPQLEYMFRMLAPLCDKVFVSCNESQRERLALPQLPDRYAAIGPMGGVLTAFAQDEAAAWLCVGCDMPFITTSLLEILISQRDATKQATTYFDATTAMPTPMVTLWEPTAYPIMLAAFERGSYSLRRLLETAGVKSVPLTDNQALKNINDPGAYLEALNLLQAGK